MSDLLDSTLPSPSQIILGKIFGGDIFYSQPLENLSEAEKNTLINFLQANIKRMKNEDNQSDRLFNLYNDLLPLLQRIIPGQDNVNVIQDIGKLHEKWVG